MSAKTSSPTVVSQGCPAVAAAVLMFGSAFLAAPAWADLPDRAHVVLQGLYKVETCDDPLFPMAQGREWFLDFGEGMSTGQTSGKVAVSLRENPNVRVRIMVWQFFPGKNTLVIGNQAAEGSAKAVARGVWTLGRDADAVFLVAQRCSITMKPAGANDY